MLSKDTSSRTSLLNAMLLKAWKERWTDSQWGINIKTVLPRGVSGDVYNLADCILQQAVIGSNANQLALSYLKHSLCAHLISHAAVLKRISKFEDFEKIYCVGALLDFLNSIMAGVTCRAKSEENVLPNSMVSLVGWLMKIIAFSLEKFKVNNEFAEEVRDVFDKTIAVIEKISKNDFLLAILYIGKQEDLEIYENIVIKLNEIKMNIQLVNVELKYRELECKLQKLAYVSLEQLDMLSMDEEARIIYCVQPLFAVVILLNPSSETQLYVSQLLMVQRLKNFSETRLYFEIFRACFMSLSRKDTSHDAMWSALTFMKMPEILKQIHLTLAQNNGKPAENLDYIPEVVEALDMIIEQTSILHYIDTKCERNFIESLLKEWLKQHIVTEAQTQMFAAKREPITSLLPKRELNTQAHSIINFVPCAEVPLSGILKALSTDYNKVQEALFGVLCQVLMGNSFDLILSVATVKGQLKTFVSRLIKCNENSKQVPNETGKQAMVRSTLFDVSFSMLTFIVQTYGSDIVLSDNGDSFFEKWARDCMVERNKMKSPRNMVSLCDEAIVDELLLTLTKSDGQLRNCNATWQDICINMPGVMYQVLVAWENETISSADVKAILDSIKSMPFSFSICASSYLCAYMQTVREDEYLKPLNMVQQFLSKEETSSGTQSTTGVQQTHQTSSGTQQTHQEHIKERFGLTLQIIRKMQNDIHPTGNINSTQNIVSNVPLEEQFNEVWKTIMNSAWLPVKSAQILESLLQASGSVWLVSRLVDQIFKCKYLQDMIKMTDIVFGVMHLDIERNTIALLDSVIHQFLVKDEGEPQSSILARLSVYCVISSLESPVNNPLAISKKRVRNDDVEEMDTTMSSFVTSSAKLRKLNSENSADSCSNDFMEHQIATNKEPPVCIKEPLQSSLQALFKTFAHFVNNDELTPRVYFIFQFITLLVECGKDRVKSILKLLPNNFLKNLLKVLATDEVKVGLICRLYDLRSVQGRQTAISDLCLMHSIQISENCINL